MPTMINLDSPVLHNPLYMFNDQENVYLVNENVYEAFRASEPGSVQRVSLADIIIRLSDNKVTKSRYF